MKFAIAVVLFSLGLSLPNTFQQTGSSGAPQDHNTGVKQRGDHAMGFPQDKATHHFYLYTNGGAIQVEANSTADTETKSQIQMHLGHIAQMFADGNFEIPMLVHDQVPPGVPVMKKKRAEITYLFEKTDRGGRVRITTTNPEALQAVHNFLRFQIADHKTGDSTQVASQK
ncbi:MAG TPA: hypothetical protein VKR82_07765 [Candidatus Acidoferrales bacterium]|nr:hypothetical protein [Candidatus Acidoferrales bacterium]